MYNNNHGELYKTEDFTHLCVAHVLFITIIKN